MADRYHQEVSRLIDSLNNQEHREEATELIRTLVDKIVLTPTDDNTGLSVDLIGDLAGILSIATKGDKPLVESGLSFINRSRQTDDSVNKDAMVAGVHNDQNLLHINRGEKPSKVSMVAGAGFEPATFRL